MGGSVLSPLWIRACACSLNKLETLCYKLHACRTACWIILRTFCHLWTVFPPKNILSILLSVSNGLDLDQVRNFVWSDPGPNCLQMLSTDDTSRQRAKLVQRKESWSKVDNSFSGSKKHSPLSPGGLS